MNKVTLCIWCLLSGLGINNASGQTITPVLITTTGGSGGGAWGHLSYSAGEPATTTGFASDVQLTQGFHQPLVFDLFDINEEDGFVVFPNPTNGTITVLSHLDIVKLVLYNELGQKILELTEIEETIDLGSFAPGVYQIVVSVADKIYTNSVIVYH